MHIHVVYMSKHLKCRELTLPQVKGPLWSKHKPQHLQLRVSAIDCQGLHVMHRLCFYFNNRRWLSSRLLRILDLFTIHHFFYLGDWQVIHYVHLKNRAEHVSMPDHVHECKMERWKRLISCRPPRSGLKLRSPQFGKFYRVGWKWQHKRPPLYPFLTAKQPSAVFEVERRRPWTQTPSQYAYVPTHYIQWNMASHPAE